MKFNQTKGVMYHERLNPLQEVGVMKYCYLRGSDLSGVLIPFRKSG